MKRLQKLAVAALAISLAMTQIPNVYAIDVNAKENPNEDRSYVSILVDEDNASDIAVAHIYTLLKDIDGIPDENMMSQLLAYKEGFAIDSIDAQSHDGELFAYKVNLSASNGNQGYVIVSANRDASPVISFSLDIQPSLQFSSATLEEKGDRVKSAKSIDELDNVDSTIITEQIIDSTQVDNYTANPSVSDYNSDLDFSLFTQTENASKIADSWNAVDGIIDSLDEDSFMDNPSSILRNEMAVQSAVEFHYVHSYEKFPRYTTGQFSGTNNCGPTDAVNLYSYYTYRGALSRLNFESKIHDDFYTNARVNNWYLTASLPLNGTVYPAGYKMPGTNPVYFESVMLSDLNQMGMQNASVTGYMNMAPSRYKSICDSDRPVPLLFLFDYRNGMEYKFHYVLGLGWWTPSSGNGENYAMTYDNWHSDSTGLKWINVGYYADPVGFYGYDVRVGSFKTLYNGTPRYLTANAGKTVTYEFTPSQSGTYTFRTERYQNACDTFLSIYKPDGTTLLTSNDDYGGSLYSQISISLTAYQTYKINVRAYGASQNLDCILSVR